MSFTVYENDILMCTGETVIAHDLSSGVTSAFSLPKLTIDVNQKHHNNADLDTYHGITAIFTSNDGQYFCVCSNRKQLCLYERSSRALISNRTLARAASAAKFTPRNDVIVADKSGDLYVYETKDPGAAGRLVLGHLSMLLDCLVTEDGARIISADRDEKIRVSRYPNAYNIESYCLGHGKFVTALAQSPRHPDVLVSAGGDGCVKFWDYTAGQELASYSFVVKIPAEETQALNESLKRFELTEAVNTLPVKHLRLTKLDADESLLVITFYGSARALVYSERGRHELSYRETLTLDAEPLECRPRGGELWILDERGLRLYTLEDRVYKLDEASNRRLGELNERWQSLRRNVNEQSLFPILYKRKFDNVQEYRERKKLRLEN